MRGKKVTASVMLLALAVACFISATAFPGEHPWDSEGSKGGGSGSNESGVVIGGLTPATPKDSTVATVTSVPSVRPAMDTWTRLVFEISFQTVRLFYGWSSHPAGTPLVDRGRSGSR